MTTIEHLEKLRDEHAAMAKLTDDHTRAQHQFVAYQIDLAIIRIRSYITRINNEKVKC